MLGNPWSDIDPEVYYCYIKSTGVVVCPSVPDGTTKIVVSEFIPVPVENVLSNSTSPFVLDTNAFGEYSFLGIMDQAVNRSFVYSFVYENENRILISPSYILEFEISNCTVVDGSSPNATNLWMTQGSVKIACANMSQVNSPPLFPLSRSLSPCLPFFVRFF